MDFKDMPVRSTNQVTRGHNWKLSKSRTRELGPISIDVVFSGPSMVILLEFDGGIIFLLSGLARLA